VSDTKEKNITTNSSSNSDFSEKSAAKRAISFNANQASLSRDEMNLAEFPLTVLSTRANPNIKTLEFSDSQRMKNGELLQRKWLITGADKFGLPTSTDDDVILGLMRLTVDKGFRERKIYFTRYELLKILRWTTEGRSYSRLTKSLDRLSGVRIRATNGFYDNSLKAYQTRNFGIIDAYEINDARSGKDNKEAPLSYFIWSETLFDSFKAGFIKKLNLELYFVLKSAVSRRLYRFLDKHFYYTDAVEKPLELVAYEKLGLSRNYKYISQVKQQIEPAAKELMEHGFISEYSFNGRGEATTVRFVSAKAATNAVPEAHEEIKQNASISRRTTSAAVTSNAATSNAARENVSEQNFARTSSTSSKRASTKTNGETIAAKEAYLRSLLETPLGKQLLQRGLTSSQVVLLLKDKNAAFCSQIEGIIAFYDHLLKTNDPKVSRNSIGFLYRAVESPFKFNIPAEFLPKSKESKEAATKRRPELKIIRARDLEHEQFSENESSHQQSLPLASAQSKSEQKLYREYLQDQLKMYRDQLTEEELQFFYHQANQRLQPLRRVLEKQRFAQAVEKNVNESLLKRLGLPDFTEWQRQEQEFERATANHKLF